jgi:membrane associated rhomboid family serine protease
MGIYDREYIRDGPGFLSSFTARGQVCKTLILINVAVFIVQLVTRQQAFIGGPWREPFTEALILDPAAVFSGQIWRLLTYAFLHDTSTWTHIVFNMLFLWWLGSDVEDIYGPREFLTFYLVAAVLGGLAFVGWEAVSGPAVRGLAYHKCLGASGAVTAVMVVCACHYPTRQILLWFFIPVPLWLLVVFQVAQDAFVFVSRDMGSGIAVTVHLAGAAFGFVYYKSQWRLLNLFGGIGAGPRRRSRPRLRVYREEPVSSSVVGSSPGAGTDEQMEAQLDAVLEKVARSGRNSLTPAEEQILHRASEVYRRRRS